MKFVFDSLRLFRAALILFSNISLSAHATEPVVLEPSSPWNIDKAPDECRMVRTFGTGAETVTVRVAGGGNPEFFDMLIAGTALPQLSQSFPLTLGLEQQKWSQIVEANSLKLPGRPEKLVRWLGVRVDTLLAITNQQVVTLRYGDKLNLAMRWTHGQKALKAFLDCHFDLIGSWGANVVGIKAAKVPPKPVGDQLRWFTPDDYPAAAQNSGQTGEVLFQVEVAVDGSVRECKTLRSAGVKELDDETCSLLKRRAKFSPALDAENRAIIGYYINRVRWRVPQ